MSLSVNAQPPSTEFLWYLPNTVEPGHRGDTGTVDDGYGTLDYQVDLARLVEDHGWAGALLGTSWGRPDTFTVAASIAARTTTFNPLIAIRPGYWRPAHFASAAATLDQLSGGRVRVNIVSGQDNLHQYGDVEGDQAERYARTKEFMRLVRRLWTEENVTFKGEHFSVKDSTVSPRPSCEPARTNRGSTRGSTSVAPPSRRSGCPRPSPTCSCSGASRWTAWRSGSRG